jgi:PKD repeat protein
MSIKLTSIFFIAVCFCLHTKAQHIKVLNEVNSNLRSGNISAIYPQGQRLWLRSSGAPPGYFVGDSMVYFTAQNSTLIPLENEPVGVFERSGNTYVVHRLLSPRVVGGTVANGGISILNTLPFTLFNKQNTPALLNIPENEWKGAALDNASSSVLSIVSGWGLRKLNLQTFQTQLLLGDSISIRDPFTGFFRYLNDSLYFQKSSGIWINSESLRRLTPFFFGALSGKLIDVQYMGNTYYGIVEVAATGARVCLARTGNVVQNLSEQYPQLGTQLSYMAPGQNNQLWLIGVDKKLYRLWNNELTEIETGLNGGSPTAIAIDKQNNKWIGTEGSGLIMVNDIQPKIGISGLKYRVLCPTARFDFIDSSKSLNGKIVFRKWDFGDGSTDSSGSTTVSHTYTQPGKYFIKLEVRDSIGAKNEVIDTIDVLPEYKLLRYPSGDFVQTCIADSVFAIASQPIQWTLPDGAVLTGAGIDANAIGRYYLQSTALNCVAKDSFNVIAPAQPTVSLQSSIDNTIVSEAYMAFGFPVPLVVSYNSDMPVCVIEWEVNGEKFVAAQELQYAISAPGTYVVAMRYLSRQNCPGEVNTAVIVVETGIPNLITANGDGVNERLQFNAALAVQLSIYNRWGRAVLQSDNYQNDWPTADTPAGVYYYRLQVGERKFNGWLQVVR